MTTQTQYGQAFLIDGLDSENAQALTRIPFVKGDGAEYDELWIQRLVMRHPSLLPLEAIERAFVDLVPICMELPLPCGSLDNLLVTPSGDLALIECKLWRNPEARRKVVVQILDYANALSKFTYEQLEEAIGRAGSNRAENNEKSRSLYEMVSTAGNIDESTFIDTVSRNLRLGRFLLLILGDGMREDVESLTEYLQQHAGLHFTLSLIELAVLKMPSGGYVIQPRTIAKTKTSLEASSLLKTIAFRLKHLKEAPRRRQQHRGQ